MKPMTLEQVARATNGRLHAGTAAAAGASPDGRQAPAGAARAVVDRVATDTRTLEDAPGTLFIALRGERFDGHDHAAAAAAAGVRALLVAREVDVALPQVVVADTTRALADLAAAAQQGRAAKVVAITGSNGKTSVKSLVLAILQHTGHAYANPGNRNNEIGLPLAVIDAPEDADFAIYEMGAGQPGDIAHLTAVVRPDVALVNNIAPAHLERMGSLLGVADTKAAIYDALPPNGVAVINADDAFAPFFAERAHGRTLLRFGIESTADVRARDIRPLDAGGSRFVLSTPQGDAEVSLSLAGRHNVRNALAAASLALGAGATLADVVAGLQAARAVAGRLATHRLADGTVLVDDSYNANPGSLQAAIETLASGGPAAWLVLGDMRELGQDAAALHAEAGRQARAAGIDRLYALGALAGEAARTFGEGGRVFADHEELSGALRDALAAVAASTGAADAGALTVLVKGSRGSAMDRIVAALLASHGKGDVDAA